MNEKSGIEKKNVCTTAALGIDLLRSINWAHINSLCKSSSVNSVSDVVLHKLSFKFGQKGDSFS